jgi:hypothetical protein
MERQTLSTESLIVELDARTAKLDAKINSTNQKMEGLTKEVQKTDKSFVDLIDNSTKTQKLDKSLEKTERKVEGLTTKTKKTDKAFEVLIDNSTKIKDLDKSLGKTADTTEDLAFESKKAAEKIKEVGEKEKDIEKLSKEIKKTSGEQKNFNEAAKKGAGIITKVAGAALAGAVAFTAYAAAQGRAMRETQSLATMAGLTAEEFKRLSFVMGTTGMTGEKFGDQMKDTQERIGDFLSEFEKTGKTTGTFNDFANVMNLTQKEALALAREFETLSGDQVLQRMVDMMQAAGMSSQKMSFALEGLATDTTKLIPLLIDGGKAAEELKKRFDEINIPLSDEEKQQFIELASNVDLAQSSFINFLNNAISPFLPAINAAGEALADFFASASVDIDFKRLLKNSDLAEEVGSLMEVEKLLTAVSERVKVIEAAGSGGLMGGALIKEELKNAKEAQAALEERKQALIDISAEKEKQNQLDLESLKGNLTGSTGKGGADKDASDVDSIRDRFKSELELLTEKYEEEKSILDRAVEDEVERNELKANLLTQFEERKQAIKDEFKLAELEAQSPLDALLEFTMTRAEILDAELIADIERLELAAETFGLKDEELYAKRIELVKKFNKEKLSLEKNSMDSKDKDTETEIKWSESSAKSQLDTGTKLLTSLGNNSKTAHKIKQGLAIGNTVMTTAENINEQFPNPLGMTLAAGVGAAQLAAIMSSTSDGGGSLAPPPPAVPEQSPQDSFNDQGTTITDISGGEMTSQRMIIEFNDEVVDALSRQIQKSQSDGRT